MTPTYSKNGHLFFREIADKPESILGDRLIINPHNIDESIIYAKNNGIKSITINPFYFKVENLDFLANFSFIEGLYLLQENLDLTPLNDLTNLRVLIISDLKPKVDLKYFENLEILSLIYCKSVLNLNYCGKIFWLWIDNFKEENLEQLSKLSSLQYLNLHNTSIIDLKGIEYLLNLRSLKIDKAIKLISLEGISEKNKCLRVVDIYGAKNLKDYSALGHAKELEKIWIRKSGDLSNIFFLQKMEKLQEVTIGAKIIDGDIRYLKNISDVNFLDFKHYNLKMKELKLNK
jgi:hypothetical protein